MNLSINFVSLAAIACVIAIPSPYDAVAEDEPKLITTIRREMSDALQREARGKASKDDSARASAIYDLTVLYSELRRDSRLPLSDTLQAYKAELWSRLSRVQSELERQFARERRGQGSLDSHDSHDSLGSAQTHQASQSLAAHVDVVAASLGGPIGMLGKTRYPGHADGDAPGGRGGAAGPPDFGPALVELIQRTIAPDSWDVNGGPGTIVYYPAFHCLVVRASGEVHKAVGGLLGGLGR